MLHLRAMCKISVHPRPSLLRPPRCVSGQTSLEDRKQCRRQYNIWWLRTQRGHQRDEKLGQSSSKRELHHVLCLKNYARQRTFEKIHPPTVMDLFKEIPLKSKNTAWELASEAVFMQGQAIKFLTTNSRRRTFARNVDFSFIVSGSERTFTFRV